jgi:hypothetical protein
LLFLDLLSWPSRICGGTTGVGFATLNKAAVFGGPTFFFFIEKIATAGGRDAPAHRSPQV